MLRNISNIALDINTPCANYINKSFGSIIYPKKFSHQVTLHLLSYNLLIILFLKKDDKN